MELKRYLEIIWRRKWLLIETVVLIAGGGLLISICAAPVYKISAQVLINTVNLQPEYFSQGPNTQFPRNLGAVTYVETRNVVDTYITLARSAGVLGKVIRGLDLRNKKGELIEIKDFVVTTANFPVLALSQKKGVSIKRLKAAEMLEIAGYSTDRDEAVEIANRAAREFSRFLSGLRRQEAAAARQTIEKQLREIELSAYLANVYKDKAAGAPAEDKKSPLPPPFQRGGFTGERAFDNHLDILISELTRLEIEKSEADRNLQRTALQKDSLLDTLHIEKGAQFLGRLTYYQDKLAQLEIEQMRLAAQLNPASSKFKKLKRQKEDLQAELRGAVEKLFAAESVAAYPGAAEKYAQIEIAACALNAQIRLLSEQMDSKRQALEEFLEDSRQPAGLECRLYTYGGGMYEFLKNRLEYVRIAEAMDISNILTVQEAQPSISARKDICFPRKKAVAVMGFMFSVMLGIVLCFLWEYLDDRITTAAGVEQRLAQPLLGVIRSLGRGRIGTAEKEDAGFYGDFWDLRSNIRMSAPAKDNVVFAVASTVRGEGKSVAAHYLARTFAEAGETVLLVELNLRRPRVREMFGLKSGVGLSDFLNGGEVWEDIVFSTEVKGLQIIPAGQTKPANPLKLIDSPQMRELLKTVRKKYDKVILDAAALEDGSDALMASVYADNVLFVVQAGRLSAGSIAQAIQLAQKRAANILGVVLNNI